LKIAELGRKRLAARLADGGLAFRITPFCVRVKSGIAAVADGISRCYADYEVLPDGGFIDFHMRLDPPAGLRRWIKPQVVFHFDTAQPFYRCPTSRRCRSSSGASPGVRQTAQQYVGSTLHVERGGHAAILPANRERQSTLCAGLVMAGWRLLG
jgi:hypothetical protein